MDDSFAHYLRRLLAAIGLVILALFLWKISNVLLLVFAGVMVAVIFHGLAQRISAHTPLSTKVALLPAFLLVFGILALFVILVGPQLVNQVQQIVNQIPQMIDQLRQYSWGRFLIEHAPQFGAGGQGGGWASLARTSPCIPNLT